MALRARLLLVDDERAILRLLSRGLLRAGYEADVAEEGHQALDMLHNQAYDLVLLDRTMPGVNGLEVLRQIRETWSPSELPVIMVTAMQKSEEVVSALRLGANDYITKPFELPIVLARIETRLRLLFAAREMRRANDFYQLALRASEEGLWDWDLSTGKLYYSERWKAMLGFSADEVSEAAEEWFGRIHSDDRPRVRAEIQAHIEGQVHNLETEYRMRHKDGRYLWMENRGSASRDASGRVIRIAGYQSDITTRKTIDPVTSLPNRTWLDQELSSIASEGKRAALLLVDLDRFDRLAESLPADGPDRLLASVAGRLHASLNGRTPAVAEARSGESQFALLLRDASGPDEAQRLAGCLHTGLQAPIMVGEEPVFVTACVGIAVTYGDVPGDHLLHGATAALRHARQRGARSEVFHAAMRQHDLAETRLVNDLRHAAERSELVVYYQPKVDLGTRQIAGFEALVRWNRPGFGLVQPNDFIVTAERTGLIVPIGRHVLGRACMDTAEIRAVFPWVEVSVNVSGRQLAEPDLVEQVRECLDSAGLDPGALRLEITETFLVEDPEKALLTLNRLRAMGVGLKLDDFGSGYSSLDYLRRFPFDTLKVDRSFVSGLASSHESAEIVRAIAGLARSLHMEMVAEGIENRAQFDWLRALGCRYGQGYWFSEPVEFSRLKELLHGWNASNACVNPTGERIACGVQE
jgi:PAS domain S-box-containing protein/diguanylate cyclase (GGDEF)-like protein